MRGKRTNVSNSTQTVICSMAFLVCRLLSLSFLLLYICHKNMISLGSIDCLPFTISIQIFESLFTQGWCPEGWDGEGVGRGVQDGEHMYTHGRFKSMYGETNTML